MYSLIGFALLLVSLFLGRWINDTAIQKLKKDDRDKLIDGLANYRRVSLGGVVVIVVTYWIYLGLNYSESIRGVAFSWFAIALIAFMISCTAYVFLKLKKMKIDEDYISSFMLSTAVQHLGLIGFFFVYRNL